ncbi:hypothetical protein KSC_043140 [Ktedonobacter sp. SOSP1-52]|uniref:DUF4342 domain-containing protein n=1 Tax=Ktedonobacter sp. SOSP1-52 TaxID=2778366 RepID=UPI0019160E36|nr:DUF4342 domain-containing protein [Ktedonobacter sp. SOSP1-52]GHO65422.1 hypothetical protein KSC_043140 [Ktedonobacter sp. SOSP1-52]
MTQRDPNTPVAGQRQDDREEFQVMGEQLVATVKRLFHEGNVRRIIIKHEGQPTMEIPLTIGVVGTLLAPWLAAIGAMGALLTHCTVEVVRTEKPGEPSLK